MEATPHNNEDTARERLRLYEGRWSDYGSNTGIASISAKLTAAELRQHTFFQHYDDAFLETLTPDISIVEWKPGVVLFEEGSYLDLAFFILEGEVDVYLRQTQDTAAQPIFNATRFGEQPAGESASDTGPAQTVFQDQIERVKEKGNREQGITYLSAMDFNLPVGEQARLGPGDIFGEIGALNGWPQSVTARTASACTLVQIRLPALRALKKKSSSFSNWIDRIYRERTLVHQLHSTPLFRGVDAAFINALTERIELVSCAPGEPLTEEDAPVEALYLVRSGFLRLSQRLGEGEITVTYLSKGMTLGEVELLIDGIAGWKFTTTSVGYTELVKIAREDFELLMRQYAAAERHLWENVVARIKESGHTRRNLDKSELIEFSLAKGLVQGNSILVIDLDVCTRCDDCVRGCASTHGGRPRFVREGEKYENFLIARSCYHCEDPVCLIGCPTGAIRRANVGEVVEIDDNLCIGCKNCATKCPYDAIVMHETGEQWPETALPEWLRGRDRLIASKCDLCHTAEEGPACVNNCPHGCAFRISSMADFQELLALDRAQP